LHAQGSAFGFINANIRATQVNLDCGDSETIALCLECATRKRTGGTYSNMSEMQTTIFSLKGKQPQGAVPPNVGTQVFDDVGCDAITTSGAHLM
jgi:hypothetical protein